MIITLSDINTYFNSNSKTDYPFVSIECFCKPLPIEIDIWGNWTFGLVIWLAGHWAFGGLVIWLGGQWTFGLVIWLGGQWAFGGVLIWLGGSWPF